MVSRVGYLNRDESRWADSAGAALQSDALQPYITRREQLSFTLNVGTNATGTYAGYTGWATGGPYSFRFFVDNDWLHHEDTTLNANIVAGPITTITVPVAGLSVPLRTGRLVLTNSASESESFDYTSFATVATDYVFTVSATASYSYLIGDEVKYIDPALVEVENTDIDQTNAATGILIISMDANTQSFINATDPTTVGAELTGCQFELQVLNGAGEIVDRIPGTFRCLNLLQDDFSNPPSAPVSNYYNKTQSDARYQQLYSLLPDLAAEPADDDYFYVFDTSTGLAKKVAAIYVGTGDVLGAANLTTQYRGVFVSAAETLTESTSILTDVNGDFSVGGVSVGFITASGTGTLNSGLGEGALNAISDGQLNLGLGRRALYQTSTGNQNTGVGYNAGNSNTIGNYNIFVGPQAGYWNTSGSANIIIGNVAAQKHANGSTNLTDPENSVYIGAECRGFDNADSNSIVVGYQAIGAGANTAVWGNTSITNHYMSGTLDMATGGDVTINGGNALSGAVQGAASLTTQYRMAYVNAAGTLTESSSIKTDAAGALLLGGASATIVGEKLGVLGSGYFTVAVSDPASTRPVYGMTDGVRALSLDITGSTFSYAGVGPNEFWMYANASFGAYTFGSDGAVPIKFVAAGSERMRIATDGTLLVGTTVKYDAEKMAIAGLLYVRGSIVADVAATQDAIAIAGRAGGIGSWVGTITPGTLTASRTWTMPDITGTVAMGGDNLTTQYRMATVDAAGVLTESAGIITDASGNLLVNTASITTGYKAEITGSLKRTISRATAYVSTAAATASITAGTPVNLLANSTLSQASVAPTEFTIDNVNKRLVYTGTATKTFNVTTTMSTTSSLTNIVLIGYIYENGTAVTASQQRRKVSTGTDIGNWTLHDEVVMATNDYVEIFVDIASGTGTVTPDYCIFHAEEVG